MFLFCGMMAEAIRRSLWAIIRVENEFHNNFESYRDVIGIPPVKDDTRDDDIDENWIFKLKVKILIIMFFDK